MKFDGVSLVPAMAGGSVPARGPLLFFGGWHVGVNFAAAMAHRFPDGRFFVYAYNLSSPNDELYDMNSDNAVNMIDDPAHADIRNEMIRMLGDALQQDPRWVGCWAEFRIARYHSLPKSNGDRQLFTKPS